MAGLCACDSVFLAPLLPAFFAPPPPRRLGALRLTRCLVDLRTAQLAVPEAHVEARHLQVLGNCGSGAAAVRHAGWVDTAVGMPRRRAKLYNMT